MYGPVPPVPTSVCGPYAKPIAPSGKFGFAIDGVPLAVYAPRFSPIWLLPLLWLIASVAVYNIRSRQLHRHAVYVQMYEWMMWTGVVTSSLMLVYWVFHFDMILVLGIYPNILFKVTDVAVHPMTVAIGKAIGG